MRKRREGVALLTVLLLVAVLSVIAVLVLDDVRFSIRRATNAQTAAQAQWHAAGAERVAVSQIRRLIAANPGRTPVDPAWDGRPLAFPLDHGQVTLTVSDGQSCFNLNSVVEGTAGAYRRREEGVRQFLRLQQLLGVPSGRARRIADATADWIDSDAVPAAYGAEDGHYGREAPPRLTGGRLMIDGSELRAVAGMDAAGYRLLRPHVCALPRAILSPLNVNTLRIQDAPLLAMLAERDLSLQGARQIIASRPAGGWGSTYAFWSHPALAFASPVDEVRQQVTLETRYFDYAIDVRWSEARAVRTGLFAVGVDGRVSTVWTRWEAAP